MEPVKYARLADLVVTESTNAQQNCEHSTHRDSTRPVA